MAKINTELTYNIFDPKITGGNPAIEMIVKDREIPISGEDILVPHNISLATFKQNKLYYWLNVTTGSGVPQIQVRYYNQTGGLMHTILNPSSPYEFTGMMVSISIQETGAAAVATYDALLKII